MAGAHCVMYHLYGGSAIVIISNIIQCIYGYKYTYTQYNVSFNPTAPRFSKQEWSIGFLEISCKSQPVIPLIIPGSQNGSDELNDSMW